MKSKLKGDAIEIPANTDDGKTFQLDLTDVTRVNIVKGDGDRLLLKVQFNLAIMKVPPIGKPGGANALIEVPFSKTKEGEGLIITLDGLSTGINYTPTSDEGYEGLEKSPYRLPYQAQPK